ncbi:MAG: peptide ABC transporter substrate-binding protein [Candidatus Rhabdochlamydia sp.]|jgi:oligopeptide transport system substrate-binding protein|nr:oligopeptide transport system substrate-binding protein [Chlamydiota bacterium]
MKKILFFLSIIVFLTFFFIKHQNPEQSDQVLHLNMKAEPKTMDPRKGGDWYSSQMHSLFFEGLVKLYPNQSFKLAQAESYEVSDDQLIYTFHLRDTVWSNNTPVTAYDFEQSWKDILDPNFPSVNAQLFYPIKNADLAKKGVVSLDEVGIKAIDTKTLVITLEQPTPYLINLLSFCVFSPVNIKNDRENPNWTHKIGPNFLCNGPFVLEKWEQGDEIIAASNPHYRKTEDVHPEKIIFHIVENDTTTLQMFEKGLVDIIGDSLTSIPLEAIPDLGKKWKISREPTATTMIIAFNTGKAPFHHPKIRKAFSLSINRQQLVENIVYQASSIATNMIPPLLKQHRDRSFFKDNDVDQAKILLEEAMAEMGITKEAFEPVTLYYQSFSSVTSKVMQAIQQQWLDALGIFIKIESLDSRVIMDKLTHKDYFMCYTLWSAVYYDPMSILERFKYRTYAKNFINWENPEYVQLLNRSFYEQGETRFRTLEEAEELFLKEMPLIPLYHVDFVYIINPRLNIPLWGDRLLLPIPSN